MKTWPVKWRVFRRKRRRIAALMPITSRMRGVQAVVPVRLALVGADPLSVAFLKKYHDRLQAEHYTVLLIGDADILRQFREAWPALEVQRFDLDNRLILMLHVIGIRYYPALYDQGQVSP